MAWNFVRYLAYCPAIMDELSGLPEPVRRLALDRFRLLQPHLEQNRPLRSVAFEARSFLPNGAALGGSIPAVRPRRVGAKATC